MSDKDCFANKKSLLASIIYLKSEIIREDMVNTEKALDNVLDSYFKDIKDKGYDGMDEELMLIKSVLEKASKMDKSDLKSFINMSYFFENDHENETYN